MTDREQDIEQVAGIIAEIEATYDGRLTGWSVQRYGMSPDIWYGGIDFDRHDLTGAITFARQEASEESIGQTYVYPMIEDIERTDSDPVAAYKNPNCTWCG